MRFSFWIIWCLFCVLKELYHSYSVKRSICANTEVRSRNIVGDSSRNNDKGNTKFLILLSSLHHLQTPNKGLVKTGRKEEISQMSVSDFH